MRKILVAVDGSEASLEGARKAVELARPFKAELVFAYAVPPMMLPGEAPFAPVEEIHLAEEARGRGLLTDAATRLGVTARPVVRVGPAAETLAELAEAEDVDMVVVGSTGKGAVTRLLLGSCADRLVHICTRPVLVVR